MSSIMNKDELGDFVNQLKKDIKTPETVTG